MKYQDTEVEAAESVRQLQEIIRRHGGRRFEQEWSEEGAIIGIRFAISHPEIGELPVSMPMRLGTIADLLFKAGYLKSIKYPERRNRIARQAERIAWRHAKDLTEQLLVSVQLGLKTVTEAFLENVEVRDTATSRTVTVGELVEKRGELIRHGGPLRITGAFPKAALELPPPTPPDRIVGERA